MYGCVCVCVLLYVDDYRKVYENKHDFDERR